MNKHLTRMQDIIKNSNYKNLIFTDFYNLYYLTEIKIDSGERIIDIENYSVEPNKTEIIEVKKEKEEY